MYSILQMHIISQQVFLSNTNWFAIKSSSKILCRGFVYIYILQHSFKYVEKTQPLELVRCTYSLTPNESSLSSFICNGSTYLKKSLHTISNEACSHEKSYSNRSSSSRPYGQICVLKTTLFLFPLNY